MQPIRRPTAGLRPPQFGTRALLAWVAMVAALLAIAMRLGPAITAAVLMVLLAVLAHVAGNAIGTRLRQSASRTLADSEVEETGSAIGPNRPFRLNAAHFAPITALSDRRSLGRSMLVAIGAGALLGSALGGTLLAYVNWQRATIVNIAFGAVSFGILGGFVGFGAGSFLQVCWGALSQAHHNARTNRSAPSANDTKLDPFPSLDHCAEQEAGKAGAMRAT